MVKASLSSLCIKSIKRRGGSKLKKYTQLHIHSSQIGQITDRDIHTNLTVNFC